jgi:hypothetical protein
MGLPKSLQPGPKSCFLSTAPYCPLLFVVMLASDGRRSGSVLNSPMMKYHTIATNCALSKIV